MDISTNLTSVNGRCEQNFPLALLLLIYNRVKYSDESIYCSVASSTWTFCYMKDLWTYTCEVAGSNLTHTVFVLSRFRRSAGLASWQGRRFDPWPTHLYSPYWICPYWICHISHKKKSISNHESDGANAFPRPSLPWGKYLQSARTTFFFSPKSVTNVTGLLLWGSTPDAVV